MNSHPFRCTAVVILVLAAEPGWAAGAAPSSEAQRQYQQDRARCLLGESRQDQATCLREAAAAYAEARRGTLGAMSESELARNATLRCEAQPSADREACVQRIRGPGDTQGSVEGGGLIRRSETVEKP